MTVWIFVITTYLVEIFLFYIINTYDRMRRSKQFTISKSFIIISMIFLLQSVEEQRIGLIKESKRVFLSILLISSFIISNSYTGALAGVLTAPKFEEPIETIQELASRNIQWGAPSDIWIMSIMNAAQKDLQTVVSRFEIKTYGEFHRLSQTRTFGFGIEELNYGSYSFGEYIKEDSLEYLDVGRNPIE